MLVTPPVNQISASKEFGPRSDTTGDVEGKAWAGSLGRLDAGCSCRHFPAVSSSEGGGIAAMDCLSFLNHGLCG